MGYFAQHAMELLDGERTVFESLEDAFPQAGQGSLRTLAGCFGFPATTSRSAAACCRAARRRAS
jgi:ATPase subunit of ABC transporter with duplicated ATPase domains